MKVVYGGASWGKVCKEEFDTERWFKVELAGK